MPAYDTLTDPLVDGHHPLKSAVIGVLVHNEESTIEKCLDAVLSEHDGTESVGSVVVVASGCTDDTAVIVRRIASRDSRVRLVIEEQRHGKVAAINLLLSESSEPIVVTVGGDMVFTPGSLVRLLEPFHDPDVGMTGVRPIPTNPRVGIVGNAVNILWDLHHELSMQTPKLGEAVAFRRMISTFEPGTVFDEATMERIALSRGFTLRYVPDATVRNRGPETLPEYLRHRTRNIREHLAMASATGYRVSTLSAMSCFRATWRLWRRGERARYIALALALEALASARARVSLIIGRPEQNVVWHPITTSKRVISDGHVLRAHHDAFQTIQIRPMKAATALERRAIADVQRITRADDRVRLAGGRLTIKVRSDTDGALAMCSRLQATLPHLVPVFDKVRTNGVHHNASSEPVA
jgi:glycosyltransferase involved in cell wall biosynthesis